MKTGGLVAGEFPGVSRDKGACGEAEGGIVTGIAPGIVADAGGTVAGTVPPPGTVPPGTNPGRVIERRGGGNNPGGNAIIGDV